MYDIAFIAHYPVDEKLKDGMFQRVKNIDGIFEDKKRLYLEISYKKNLKPTFIERKNLKIIRLNYFLHRKQINNYITNSKKIYIHSIYNFKKIDFLDFSNKEVILDAHGIVPEEQKFMGAKLKGYYMKYIERKLIKNINTLVVVTENMKKWYEKEYDIKKTIVYPIISKNVFRDVDRSNNICNDLGIGENDIVFLYSGNCQKWQNIDLMVERIKELKNPNYKFIILTGEVNKFNNYFREINNENIIVKSVLPNELAEYYSIANYGFLLRDQHILNEVACPTKMLEYLYYGIVPIVKSEKIGDFNELEYEYIFLDDINKEIKQVKSTINIDIAKNMINNYELKKLTHLL
ncbi:MAG: glycosyltransferase [Sarcina sp.]